MTSLLHLGGGGRRRSNGCVVVRPHRTRTCQPFEPLSSHEARSRAVCVQRPPLNWQPSVTRVLVTVVPAQSCRPGLPDRAGLGRRASHYGPPDERPSSTDQHPEGDIEMGLPPRVARRLQAADAPGENHTHPPADWATVSRTSIAGSQLGAGEGSDGGGCRQGVAHLILGRRGRKVCDGWTGGHARPGGLELPRSRSRPGRQPRSCISALVPPTPPATQPGARVGCSGTLITNLAESRWKSSTPARANQLPLQAPVLLPLPQYAGSGLRRQGPSWRQFLSLESPRLRPAALSAGPASTVTRCERASTDGRGAL